MTIATVTTDIHIGPYVIPSNAQNMMMNNYCSRYGLEVSLVIPEPIKSRNLATMIWLGKDFVFTDIVLSSIYQLSEKSVSSISQNFESVTFHFVIEGISGSGGHFLKSCLVEKEIFEGSEVIDSEEISWSEAFDMKNKIMEGVGRE